MANAIRISASVDDKASGPIDRIRDKMTQVQSQGVKGFGIGVGAAVAAKGLSLVSSALGSAVDLMGDAARKASELEQAIGGTEAVFKGNSDIIGKWADRAAGDVGLSEAAFRTATTGIGGQLKRMSGDLDFATTHSRTLVRVAADLAATYGGTTAEAVEALGAALRGEADPAERFNLNLKASVVNAKAVEMGLAQTTSSVEEHAKAQAILALVLEQSADAQGQFAREADTTAGAMQRMQARVDDGMAEVGKAIASIQLGAIKVASAVGDAAGDVGSSIDRMALDWGDFGSKTIEIAERTGAELGQFRDRVAEIMRITGLSFAEAAEVAELEFAKIPQTAKASFEAFSTETHAAMLAAKGIVDEGVADMVTKIGDFPEDAADELLKNQFTLKDATTELLDFMSTALDPAEQVFQAQMFLAGSAAAAGLASSNPIVRKKTEEMIAEAQGVIANFGAWGYGYRTGTSFGDGMNAAYGYVRTAAGNLAAATRNQIGINSEPKDFDSPLRGITKWGGNIVSTMAEGMTAKLGVSAAASRRLAASLVPSMPGDGAGGFVAGGSGTPLVIQVQLDGRTIAEVVNPHMGSNLRLSQGRRFIGN